MYDEKLAALIRRETDYYLNVIDLIAASNAPTSRTRSNATWGVAQFRSAEGCPGRRPYAGTANFDAIERLTIERARQVFGADHANVQPLSGTLANAAAYRATLHPGDTILSMSMRSGGHLSHGHPRYMVSDLYQVVTYDVLQDTGMLDYDALRAVAIRQRPRAIVAGFSAYPRAVNFATLASIAAEVDATLIADISHIAGLVACGLHPNPCQTGAVVTSSVEKTLRGTRGGFILCPESMASAVDSAVFPGLQSSIGMAGLVSLASLLHEAGTEDFLTYQKRTVMNSHVLAETLLEWEIPLLTGGTDTHLIIAMVARLGLTGRDAEQRLEAIGILSNRNWVPFDPRPPFEASGLRLGTPTITARGFDAADVREVGRILGAALRPGAWTEQLVEKLRARVRDLVLRDRGGDTLADLLRGKHEGQTQLGELQVTP